MQFVPTGSSLSWMGVLILGGGFHRQRGWARALTSKLEGFFFFTNEVHFDFLSKVPLALYHIFWLCPLWTDAHNNGVSKDRMGEMVERFFCDTCFLGGLWALQYWKLPEVSNITYLIADLTYGPWCSWPRCLSIKHSRLVHLNDMTTANAWHPIHIMLHYVSTHAHRRVCVRAYMFMCVYV